MTNINNYSSFSGAFDPTDNNEGSLVTPRRYQEKGASHREIGNAILSQIGGGKEFGFDLSNVVEAMVGAEMGGKIPQLKSDITNTNVRISALSQLENIISQLQKTTLSPLESGLSPYQLQSSNPAAVSLSESSTQAEQIDPFNIQVSELALVNTWEFTQAYPDPSTTLTGSGDLSISLADGREETFKIESNSSLNAIAKKIKDSSSAVSASVIQQSDGYHLVLSSNATGSKNEMTVNFSADPASDELNNFFATKNERQVAKEASYSVNGVTMTSDSNHINYQGIQITLNAENVNSTVSTQVQTGSVNTAINGFVSNFNELLKAINQMTDSTSGKNFQGAFNNDSDIEGLVENIRTTLLSPLSSQGNLYQLGVEVNEDGTLSVNQSKLAQALTDDPGLGDRLFSTKMLSTNSSIDFVKYKKNSDVLSDATESGTYAVNVTQIATEAQHELSTSLSLTNGKVTLSNEVTLAMNLTGQTNPGQFTGETKSHNISVTLPSGEYTPEDLADYIQTQINEHAEIKESNAQIKVSVSNNKLVFASDHYGALTGFNFDSAGSTNANEIGMETADMDIADGYRGQNVIGSINGQFCLSDGQYLQAQSDKIDGSAASGIVLRVSGDNTGDLGTVTLSRGYGDKLDSLMNQAMNSSEFDPTQTGVLARKLNDYQKQVDSKNLSSLIAELNEAEEREEMLAESYYQKYKDVNSILSKMSYQSEYIKNSFQSHNHEE